MNGSNDVATSNILPVTFTPRIPESSPKHDHTHNLNDVQRRAYRIHQRHGGIGGGYTLEDWLEAEHELDEEDDSQPSSKARVH